MMERFGQSFLDKLYPRPNLKPLAKEARSAELKAFRTMTLTQIEAYWLPYQKLIQELGQGRITLSQIENFGGKLRDGVEFHDVQSAISRGQLKGLSDKDVSYLTHLRLALQEVVFFAPQEEKIIA